MKKKNIVSLCVICSFILASTIGALDFTRNEDEEDYPPFEFPSFGDECEGCCGLVATGTVVKDNRSIFWKNRHSTATDVEPNHYDWPGANYSFWLTGPLGFNEVGLAIGNFQTSDCNYTLNNPQGFTDNSIHYATIMYECLANYSTVGDAVAHLTAHLGENCMTVGIVSKEPGVGAVIDFGWQTGQRSYHVSWINNSFAALANHFYEWNDNDSDWTDIRIEMMCWDILNNGTGIDEDCPNLISWRDVVQWGARNVSGLEWGADTFSCASKATHKSCTNGMVAVSGNDSFNGSGNIAWVECGRQPLVGIFLPLGCSYIHADGDFPSFWRDGNGMEDYTDYKVNYASGSEPDPGDNTYNCSKTREIQNFTFTCENWTFDAYEEFMDNFGSFTNDSEVEDALEQFADENSSFALENYTLNQTMEDYTFDTQDYGSSILQININHSFIMEPLVDFPLLVKINSTIGSTCDGGNSIRFNNSDNTSELNYEIDCWNSSSDSFVWVRVPEVSSNEDTVLWMTFNNSEMEDGQNTTGVWDDNFVLVCHMNDYNSTQVNGSTFNAFLGAKVNASDENGSGKIGNSQDLSYTSNTTITFPHHDVLNTTWEKITVEGWWKFSDTSTTMGLWSKGATPGYTNGWDMYKSGTMQKITWRCNGWNCTDTATENDYIAVNDMWYYHSYTFDNSSLPGAYSTILYINDEYLRTVGSGGCPDYRMIWGSLLNNSNDLTLGKYKGTTDYYTDGGVDEVRISNIARNESWINATFYNVNRTDEFVYFGDVQSSYNPSKVLRIAIDHDYIDEPLAEFPVLIPINATLGAECDSGNSISFNNSDNTTVLNFEIENGSNWDESGTNYVWVNVTEVSADEDTVIWMRYNDTFCDSQENADGVWNINYTLVHHLNETSGTFIDSSLFSNDGTLTDVDGSCVRGTPVTIGSGVDLTDNSSDYISFGSDSSLHSDNFTYELMIGEINHQDTHNIVVGTWNNAWNHGLKLLNVDVFGRSLIILNSTCYAYMSTVSNTTTAKDTYYAFTMTGASKGDILNSTIQQNLSALSLYTGSLTTLPLEKTGAFTTGYSGSGGCYLNGTVDEIRMSNCERNASWLKASYHSSNQTFDFLKYGPQYSEPTVSTLEATSITNSSAIIWGNLTSGGGENCTVWLEWDTYTVLQEYEAEEEGECGCLIATGTACRDGRSIIWKNRHSTNEYQKVYFYNGTNYSYWGVGNDSGMCRMGMNEKGLILANADDEGNSHLLGNYSYNSDEGSLNEDNDLHIPLGNWSTVEETVDYLKDHMWLNGLMLIVSAQPGVGALVSKDNANHVNVTWMNNTWAPIANCWYTEQDQRWNDPDAEVIYDVVLNWTTNSTTRYGDDLICYEDCVSILSKLNNDYEPVGYSGTYSLNTGISKYNAKSFMVALGGNDSYDGALSMAWLGFGNTTQLEVGLPLGIKYMEGEQDIPANFTESPYNGNLGIQYFTDEKSNYAISGNSVCRSCVRDIWNFTKPIENMTFNEYNVLMETIMTCANVTEANERIERFADEQMYRALKAYVENSTFFSTNSTSEFILSGIFNDSLTELYPGTVYHYRAFANNSAEHGYGEELRFMTLPKAPTGISVVNNGSNFINFSWSKGNGSHLTVVERNTSSDWTRGNGTVIYSGPLNYYNDTGLPLSTTYYYKFWGYTEEEDLSQYSFDNADLLFETEGSTETITFTLETALDINIANITEVPIIVNITTNNTRIKNETILFARTASYDTTAKNASFMAPSNPVAPNLIRGHGRNLGYWFEQFNDSGTGELGEIGEWSCGALPNSSKFTVLNYGDNWTRVQVLPCSCALFPKFWYLDRKQMMYETKTDQYSPIYSQNILKTEFNLTGITPDEYAWNNNWLNATHHIFFYANATSGDKPLNVWYANESYTTGNPSTSPYCVFLGSVTPGQDYSYSLLNSKYYNLTFSTNNGSIGGIGITTSYYFIFTSNANYDDAWKLYYADGNETVGTGYFDFLNTTVAEISTNNGTVWHTFGNDTIDDEVLWLKFDEGAGDVCIDSSEIYSGHYHNGTRNGATWNASGHEGSCLDFDGTTDYVNITNDPDGHLNFTTEMTVSCLINPANLAPYDYWISKEDSFRFGTSNNKNRPRFGFYRGGWKQESTGNDYLFDGDTWYHVAVTFNSTEPETVVMYVNGTEVHRQSGFAGTGNMESGIGDIYIGIRYGITAGFEGSIDDVRLWSRVLAPDEIYDVYTNVTRKGCPDVNFNVGNPESDRVIYKVYAELENGTQGTWSQSWFDVLGDFNFPPASLTVVSPQVNGTYYALDNQTILFEWLGDPNYDDCWLNTTIEYTNGTFINWYNNRSIPGWYQKGTVQYINYFTPSNFSLKAGEYRFNVTITDNQSATTNDVFRFKITELNITSPSPTDQTEDVAIPLDYFAITINHSYGEPFNITWRENTTGTVFNTSYCTSNGTYYAYNTSWISEYNTEYRWAVNVNETGSVHWLNDTSVFVTQDEDESDYYIKPGYPNCTYGPPDFDQKQEDCGWEGIHPGDMVSPQWYMCGPVALTNCLWWLDCKTNNNSNPNYRLPALCPGCNTTDPNNVVPLVDWVASYINCTMPMGIPGEHHGTNASSMTEGILNIINATVGWSDTFSLEVEGDGEQWDASCRVNYTNITTHLDNCDDVVVLLGFYCGDVRVGGHYVQVAGYNSNGTGLLFADPYFDNAENGNPGWNSTHNHDFYGNASHNWTQNVSYDYYDITIGDGPGESICDWCYVQNYSAGNGSNWSYLNHWDNTYEGDAWGCTSDVNVTLEIAWYIKFDCCIQVDKSVWNETSSAWEEGIYEDWIENNTVIFNISWHDCGDNIDDNITIVDTLYNHVEYINGTSVFYHTNGTSYAREPDYMTTEGGEFWHQHLYWNLTQDEADMVYCNTSYITYNASTENVSGYGWNNVTIYVTEYDHEFWDSDCYNESSAFVYVSQLNETITCPCCGIEASDWNLTEHPKGGSLENSDWLEYEATKWLAYNETLNKEHNWSWAYRYDNSDGTGGDIAGLSYTISNHTSANRTSSLLRARFNHTGNTTTEPYVGVIYSFTNNDEYDMVLFGTDKAYLLSKMVGGAMVNTKDGTAVASPDDCYNYWEVLWPCDPGFDYDFYPNSNDTGYDGIWIRTLYNSLAGTINAKAWPIFDSSTNFDYDVEPPGWVCDNETAGGSQYEDLEEPQSVCWGLVTWNPYDVTFTADFDKIDMWRLNYSRDEYANTSQLENHPIYGEDGIPLMTFPLHNITLKQQNQSLYMDCFYEYMDGNLTWDEYLDCVTLTGLNLSSFFSMESRYYTPNISCSEWTEWDDQNGSIYYYTTTFTNISSTYHEALGIHIEDTTDGTQDDFDSAVMCIDVDNDRNWDDNDIAIVWWAWYDASIFTWQTNITMYHGLDEFSPSDVDAIAGWEYALDYGAFESCMPPYHRNYFHRSYFAEIPRYYFEKGYVGSHQYLNSNDTFGLHVMTINRGLDEAETLTAVWENWNESNNYSLYNYYACDDEFDGHLTVWDYYMNLSTDVTIADFYDGVWTGVNESNIQYWGHGRIGNEWQMEDSYNDINATIECNISQIVDTSTWHHVNYTIVVTNTGSVNNTNVTVNHTLPTGSTYVMTSLPPANATGSDKNYTFNLTTNQKSGDTDSFNVTVNVSANAVPSGTYLFSYVNGTCIENAYDSSNDSFLYGSNTAPVINWTYPGNNSVNVDLLLANISCFIYDADGDIMNVSFYTNKTSAGSSGWCAIGENLTVGAGVFMCNQTFNNSQRYNTKWRWGNTTYYFWVNLSDGTIWNNRTFRYRTEHSRYDVTSSNDVTATDVITVWNNRQEEYAYLGLYDVDASTDITATDVSLVWSNRT